MNNIGRRGLAVSAAALVATALVPGVGAQAATKPKPRPTVVLVHGAFADASSWAGVAQRLLHDGYKVVNAAVPLRSLAYDSDYVAGVVKSIPGRVLLVGHSYGGSVITNAATKAPGKTAGLVYVTGFAPDKGESNGSLDARFKGPASKITTARPLPAQPGVPAPGPNDPPNAELTIKPGLFRKYFAQDVPGATAAVMAASQRPVSIASLAGLSGDPGWKKVPTWYAVASKDRMIPPAGQRFMAKRMHATTVTISGSHAVTVSKPGAVTKFIETAATKIQKGA